MQENESLLDRLRTFWARFGIWITWALISLAGSASDCRAETGAGQSSDWEVTANQLTYDQYSDSYSAEGDVTIRREGRTLMADRISLDQKSRQAFAEGNILLMSGQDRITGNRMRLNLDDETGELSEGKLFLAENNMYVTGQLILKTGPHTYFAKEASVTTCDGPDPDWRITGKDLKVTIEGYGFVKHAAFWADQIPIMYTPYLVFPVKLKRQSGLLTPELGFSDRKGAEYLQPFFWAIGDSTDATFFADYMSERGPRVGAEYRYVASARSLGTFMADAMDDRRIDDGQADHSENWGYTSDAYLRTNNERYWLRGKVNQDLPWGLTAKVDVDVVSDQDYLQDFKNGFSGFEENDSAFLRTYGRDIDDYTMAVRKNQLNLNRLWNSYTFNTNARWYHDAIQDRPSSENLSPLQSLPEITLDGIKQTIAGSALYYDLASSYSYFYREEGDRGHRADVYTRLYYPTLLFNGLSFEPSAGIRQTVWRMEHDGGLPTQDGQDHYRTLYDLKLDTSTDLYRIYEIDRAGSDRLKHTIRPQLIYQYVPDEDQSDYPSLDPLDRITPHHLITFALTQNLIARKTAPAGKEDARPVYIPFLRLRLEESFDINKYKDRDPRPFSDLFAELNLRPGRYVQLDADALWRPYDGEFYGYNLALNLMDLRGDRLNLYYRLTRRSGSQDIKSINAQAVWQVMQQWQLRGKYEQAMQSNDLIESGIGISYLTQCWRVDLDYEMDEENNSSIAVMVHLIGLGAIGG